MLQLPPLTPSGALFSSDNTYRYLLWRVWQPDAPRLLFVGLNPATADAHHNDPTIKRCLQFAQTWGYGTLLVANLFAYRTPHPSHLLTLTPPSAAIGPDNDNWLHTLPPHVDFILLGWGNHGPHLGRAATILPLLPNPHCLKINKTGQPTHPLYQPQNAQPFPYLPPST
ncbi:MAG TPA: DUF1643 domain-containing protein [Anaerolineae bacterium]|nr:DUF1643 domain-containing protein [Anaerolineae bacterium]